MADIKDLNSYTFPNGQKLIDLELEKYDLFVSLKDILQSVL